MRAAWMVRIAMLLLAAVLLAGLAGCSGGKSDFGKDAAPGVPDFVGAWDMTSTTEGEKAYSEKEIATIKESGLDFFININEDGPWLLCYGHEGNVLKGTWAQSGDGNLTLTNEDEGVWAFAIEGDTAALNKMSFKKVSREPKTPPAAPASSSSAESASAEAEDAASTPESETEDPASSGSGESGEVSSDLKEALDSYEAFIDEYVAFMQEYKDSGNAVSMLSAYTNFLSRYTDFAQKIDGMDTSVMSTADYAYYIEVTARVSQKLLGAL